MAFSHVFSAAIRGMDVRLVEIEVNTIPLVESGGDGHETNPGMVVVGLPDAAIRESRERVWGAISHSQRHVPKARQIVNLAPADLRKSGTAYDLPIALGLMMADGQMTMPDLRDTLIIGELALSGQVRGIHGVLSVAMFARDQGMKRLIVPWDNAREAALASGMAVYGVRSLSEAMDLLCSGEMPPPVSVDVQSIYANVSKDDGLDYVDVKGQESAKRAMAVAAAGGHAVLLMGTPGCGKSMIARRLPSILPLLDVEEALEVTKVYSIAGLLDGDQGLIVRRPFRAPHHTVSDAGLIGGSANPRPGEISLAHNGVLFLDELPEFKRNTLETLRQPLESGEVTLARASGTFVFPARVMLVAAMNPCPCGYLGHPTRSCHCTRQMVQAYRSRISGPLIDRIDIHVEVAPLGDEMLTRRRTGESSASLKEKVMRARAIQGRRYAGTSIRDNASLSGKFMDEVCALSNECVGMLKQVISDLQLSARAYDRILRVARTLADLDAKDGIEPCHIWEASNYRILDRQGQ